MTSIDPIRLGISKGSLEKGAFDILERAGIQLAPRKPNQYIELSGDPRYEITAMRPRNIVSRLANGQLDAAIIGDDWLREADLLDPSVVCYDPLNFSRSDRPRIDWVFAVPESDVSKSVPEFLMRRADALPYGQVTIATEMPRLAAVYLDPLQAITETQIVVEYSDGGSEALVGRGVDAIIDVSDSGDTLLDNKLRPLAKLCSTTAVFAYSAQLAYDTPIRWSNDPRRAMAFASMRACIVEAAQARATERAINVR